MVDIKHGESVRYFDNIFNNLIDPNNSNDSNNICVKCTYFNGRLDGKYEEYYNNGNIKLISNYKYIYGNKEYKYKHGDIIEYYKSGQINNKGYYIENKLIEYITYDENGEIIKKINNS